MHMPSRVFDIFQELFELTQDTPRISHFGQCQVQNESIHGALGN